MPAFEPIAVFDADAPTALAFISSLGKAGVPIHVYSHQRFPPGRASRHAVRFQPCPDVGEPDRFLPWLEGRIAAGEICCIAPTSDLLAFYLAEVRHLLPRRVQAALPTQDAALRALFKDRFAVPDEGRLCTPWTFAPSSVEEAHDLAAGLSYPVVLKPRTHVTAPWARGHIVGSADELRAAYEPLASPHAASVLARYPLLELPVIQAYMADAASRLYSVSGVLGLGGEAIAVAGTKKRNQWPPELGVGLSFEPWHDDELMAECVDFVRAQLGTGIFELEVILDDDGHKAFAIDLNPRAHGQIRFDIARGNDLPLLWYRQSQGEQPAPQPPPRLDGRWVHSIPLHLQHWIHVTFGPRRVDAVRAYLQEFRGDPVDIVWDGDDPGPAWLYAGHLLKHPGGLVRPLLKAKIKARP